MSIEPFLGLVVAAFAAHRVQRVVTADTISARFRAWLWGRAYERVQDYDSEGDRDTRTVRRSWAWEKAFQLCDCPHCLGFWCSLATYAAWFHWHVSFARPVIAAVAVAGIQSFVSSRQDA